MASKTMMFVAMLLCLSVGPVVLAEDPYHFFEWNVTYGIIAPLGVPQQGILINGQFPGPTINCTSNNNIVVNVFNNLDEPFLLTWAGIQHRKNSWDDGTLGTMCPIMPGTNYTYRFQVKDQIGSYFYYPTTALHRASGAMGMLQIHSRDLIPVPFNNPAEEYAVLIGDWYNKGHKALKGILDAGFSIGLPDGIHINGKSGKVGELVTEPLSVVEPGKTYRYRVCNVGMRTTLNFRIQGHTFTLVELEGSHTVQNIYDSMDLHVGQCMSVLVTANQVPMDYYFVVSSRFVRRPVTAVAVVRYVTAALPVPASPALPLAPPEGLEGIIWSVNQFRSFRWNLTASAARPNPQGSYHYGMINITRTIRLANSVGKVNGKLRFGINGVSHVPTETPLKLSEYFGLASKEFSYDLVKDVPSLSNELIMAPSVMTGAFRNFVEIVFENNENTVQTWHLDGYSFFAVAIEPGTWDPEKRKNYNMLDAVSRHTIHVYPHSWAAILTTLDNAGMWNLRSDMAERAYLGQQMYVSVLSPNKSLRDESNLPATQELCGIVKGLKDPAPYV